MPDSYQRNVIVANKVARILGILAFVLLIILIAIFGFTATSPIIFGVGGFFFFIPYLHKKGFVNLGRMLLCIVPVLVTLIAALLAKTTEPTFTDILYYDARFFLIVFAVVPCLIFSTSESFQLYGSLGIMLLLLMLFDPIHEMFQVGYFQRGFSSSSYYYINYVALIVFFWNCGRGDQLKACGRKDRRVESGIQKRYSRKKYAIVGAIEECREPKSGNTVAK